MSSHKMHGAGRVSAAVERANDFKGTTKRLFGYFKTYKFQFILVILLIIAGTILSAVAPKILGSITTLVFNGSVAKLQGVPGAFIDFEQILVIAVRLIIIYLVSAACTYTAGFVLSNASQKTMYNLRRDVDNKIPKLPLRYFDSTTHGDILSRVTNDVDTISTSLQQSVNQFVTSITTVISVAVMMLSISPLLTLIAILTLPFTLLFTKNVVKRSQKYFRGQQQSLGRTSGYIEEMYTGHNVVRVFNHEQTCIDQFEQLNEDLYQNSWKAQFISSIMMPIVNFIGNIGYVLVCVLGGILAATSGLAVGNIQAFLQYMRQFTNPIGQIANIMNMFQSTIAAAERVFDFLDETEEIPESEKPKKLDHIEGNVQFDHVQFGYRPDRILIHDLNIDVHAGQTVAIVGPTGAGKTTIINLLLRFYDVNSGSIKVDGVDIRDMRREDLRSIFGMVLQDTWLFGGTIMENIRYGKLNATDEEVKQAAKSAFADSFIKTLPEGYDTMLNEEANNISQGQKQLLTIARAILSDPPIMILDEATSSVDTRTELLIQQAMKNLMHGRTNFVIAHRLSTIRHADMILVLKDGDIIEMGNHDSLMAQHGFYYNLYNSQFASSQGA